MAKKTIVVLIDDLTGNEIENGESIHFSVGGESYDIDLSKENADAFRAALAPYVKVATKQVRRGRPKGAATTKAAK